MRVLSFLFLIAVAFLLVVVFFNTDKTTCLLATLIVATALFVVTSIGASINDGPKKRFLSDDG